MCSCDLPPELIWGCQPIQFENPHDERIRSFCSVNPRLFASSDTNNVVLWNTRTILARIELPARAMCALPSLDSIACYIAGSSFLHFIRLRHPFPVTKHPLSFSNMLIVSMHFFERSSLLVCSGHGILVCKFTPKQDIENINMERVAVLYPDIKFTNPTVPCFVSFLNLFIVPIGRTLYIHSADGTLQTELNDVIGGEITSLSFFAPNKFIVMGTANGIVKVIRYGTWETVYEQVFDEKKIISATIFERNFLVIVDSSRTITTIDVKSKSRLQMEPVAFDVEFVHVIDQFMVMRGVQSCQCYWCHIYTKHYCDVNGEVKNIERCSSATRAARVICWTDEDEMMLMEPRTGSPTFWFSTPSIHSVNYHRDFGSSDLCLVVTELGRLLQIDFSEMNKGGQNEGLFESLKPDFDGKWLKITQHSVGHTSKKCIACFILQSGRYNGVPAAVLCSGKIRIFGERKEQIHTGLNRLVDAVYCAQRDLIVMSSVDQCFVFSLDEQELIATALDVHYSCLKLISNDLIACGSVDGSVQLRSLPDLEVVESTRACNDNIPMFYNRDDIKNFNASVIKIDYCQTRKAILAFSKSSGINIYDCSLHLIAHVEVPFTPSNVCFLDGSGAILIASYCTIYVVDWSKIFSRNLPIVETEFDDFDLRQDGLHTMKVVEIQTEEVIPKFRTKKVDHEDDTRLKEDRFRVSRRSLPNFMNMTASMKRQFKIEEEDEPENVEFHGLQVDEDFFPKKHFAPERPDDEVGEWTDDRYPNIDWKVHVPLEQPVDEPEKVHPVLTKEEILAKQIEVTKREILAERERDAGTAAAKKQPIKMPRKPLAEATAPRRASQTQPPATESQRKPQESTQLPKKRNPRKARKDPNEERRRLIEEHYMSMVGERAPLQTVERRDPPPRVSKRKPIGPPEIRKRKEPNYTIKMKMTLPTDSDSYENEPPVDLTRKFYDDVSNITGRSLRDSNMFTAYRIDGFDQPFAGYMMVCESEMFRETPKEVKKFGTWKVTKGETLERRKIRGERKPPLMSIRTIDSEKRLVAPPEPSIKVIREKKPRLRSDGIGPHHVTVSKY